MARYLFLALLSLLSAATTLAQSCTPSNARSLDADVVFLAIWGILAVSWDAIADVKKRSPALEKRDLVCSSTEECLSFKGADFCLNDSTKTFHTADGTTGDFTTGYYTLADGRVGNMYHGPYPTNSKSGAAVTQSASSAAVSSVTSTVTSSVSTPVRTNSAASQQGATTSQVGTATVSKAAVTPTTSSSTVLKNSGSWMRPISRSLGNLSFFIALLGVLIYI